MFKRLRKSLTRTRQSVFGQIANALGTGDITEETYEDLEALLIQADVGVETTLFIVEQIRDLAAERNLFRADQLVPVLRDVLRGLLADPPPFEIDSARQITIVMVVGVNGAGKTTTIGKLSKYYRDLGRKVVMVAGDTFRAAAIDQLKIWAERAGVEIVAGQPGHDPGAIIYDGIRATRARGFDLLFVDTAGRLHTKFNLMQELEKVYAVCQRSVHRAPHEVLLVLDAPTGQNALLQARKFKEAVNVTGVVLTKLDGTSKGGMVFSIYRDLGVPVRFVGTGEGIDDIAPFDPDAFIDGLFDSNGE